MKTRDLVKTKALELFNRHGVVNVTLRRVAEELGKSYGNLTYYYKTKEALIEDLYTDMQQELLSIRTGVAVDQSLCLQFLRLPALSYAVSFKYLFFYADYLELRRQYPDFMKKAEHDNQTRAALYMKLLRSLQEMKYLEKDLDTEDLAYLMDLSGIVRTFYFQRNAMKACNEKDFSMACNRLLKPYLSNKGKKVYNRYYELK